jgi:hypothetical protein
MPSRNQRRSAKDRQETECRTLRACGDDRPLRNYASKGNGRLTTVNCSSGSAASNGSFPTIRC